MMDQVMMFKRVRGIGLALAAAQRGAVKAADEIPWDDSIGREVRADLLKAAEDMRLIMVALNNTLFNKIK